MYDPVLEYAGEVMHDCTIVSLRVLLRQLLVPAVFLVGASLNDFYTCFTFLKCASICSYMYAQTLTHDAP